MVSVTSASAFMATVPTTTTAVVAEVIISPFFVLIYYLRQSPTTFIADNAIAATVTITAPVLFALAVFTASVYPLE